MWEGWCNVPKQRLQRRWLMPGSETKQGVPMGSESKALNKYLTFWLGKEEYGIRIDKVQRIIGLTDVTPVPKMPDFVRGVMNVRGKIIPVVDLRVKFGMEILADSERACIIVVEVQRQNECVQIGMLVDSVSEVVNIEADSIEDPSGFGQEYNVEFLEGIAQVAGGVRILLNTDRVLTVHETLSLSRQSAGVAGACGG
jgi:purine-binding chemotaxis protein CheW